MKLFYSPTSPYVRKILIALIETGHRDDVELVPVAVTPLNPGDQVPTQNPLGKIPCMMLENGQAIYDSRVICRYIDARFDDVSLYPSGDNLWSALTLEATADGINEAAILIAYERLLRPAEQQSSDWIEAQWAKISRALDSLENNWMGHLNGGLDMAAYAVGVALGYLDLRHADRNWRDGRLNLAAWEAETASRPSFVATKPELPK